MTAPSCSAILLPYEGGERPVEHEGAADVDGGQPFGVGTLGAGVSFDNHRP
jgi:hypothetical protein